MPPLLCSAPGFDTRVLRLQAAPAEEPASRHSSKDGVIASAEQAATQRVANNVVPKPALSSAPRVSKSDADLTDELLSVLTAF